MKAFWLLPWLTVLLAAADITGRWSGSIEIADVSSGTTINTPVRAEFEQKANQISGKFGRQEDAETEAIRNGRMEGKRVLFEVTSPETNGAMKFDLTVDGDRIEGEMKGSIETGPIVGKVKLMRQGSGPAARSRRSYFLASNSALSWR